MLHAIMKHGEACVLAKQYLQFAKLVVVSIQKNKVSPKNTKSAEVILEIAMILQVHRAANNPHIFLILIEIEA